MLRYSVKGDTFLPFGAEVEDNPDPGELVYAVGHQVRTRRWAWRQNEYGKIDENSSFIFFPIDGFVGFNDDKVKEAAKQLEELLQKYFGCKTKRGFVDKNHPSMNLD